MIGNLIREWRQLRGFSQLDLALDAEVSSRHVSFMETGRSRPSRDMVLKIATALNVPLRDRNTMLIAAGFAPHYGDCGLDQSQMQAVRRAVTLILRSHEPCPAVALDSAYNVIEANSGFHAIAALGGIDVVEGKSNLVHQFFNQGSMRELIENWPEVAAHMIIRLRSEVRMRGPTSPLAEVLDYALDQPGVSDAIARASVRPDTPFIPVTMNASGQRTSWFSTMTTFGAPQDAFLEELVIEQFHPADPETEMLVMSLAAVRQN